MARNNDVSWFVSFHTHNPSRDDRCICYAITRGRRCGAWCEREDIQRATKLHKIINDLPPEAVDIQLMEKYILCVCCEFGKHKDRIVDTRLLKPLAERWLDEIMIHTEQQGGRSIAAIPPPTPAPKLSSRQLADTPPAQTRDQIFSSPPRPSPSSPSMLRYRHNTPIPNNRNTTSSTPVSSESGSQVWSPTSSTISPKIPPIPPESQERDRFRSCNDKFSTNIISPQRKVSPPPELSEFRGHIAKPSATDSVASKIRDKLIRRDVESGSLYIFDRTSSPGHVKIGWTARSVTERLKSWSECGYTPHLRFRVDDVPHAQRVETLTHYELIKEWRRERMCKAEWCRKSHQEWFEVSKERAIQVLGDWAKFMKVTEPYDSNGYLKIEWKKFVEKTVRSGELVTSAKLLQHYNKSLTESTRLKESTKPAPEPKSGEQEQDVLNTSKLVKVEDLKRLMAQLDSPSTELLASGRESRMFEGMASPEPVTMTSICSPGLKEWPKIDPVKPLKKDATVGKALPSNELSPEQMQPAPSPPAINPIRSGDLEDNGQVDALSERGDRSVPDSAIKAEDASEITVTEAEQGVEDDDWDNEETLVEIVSLEVLKETPLKIVEGLGPETSIVKTDCPELQSKKVAPATQVVA